LFSLGARDARPRLGRSRQTIDPQRPHEYQPGHDAGIGALTVGGGLIGPQSNLASTGSYTRTIGCALPGCGKPRDHLIHAPSDE
jgi:hypothetical protein